MGFASDTGYVPATIEELMNAVMDGHNETWGTSYTTETWLGTNWYKFYYPAVQRLQKNDVKTSEIFAKMQQYFALTNEVVLRPNTTHPGIYDYFASRGFLISTKPPADVDAGKLYVCVDIDDNHARGYFTITSYANLISGTDDSVTVGATVFTAQSGAATPGTGTFQAATSNALTAASLALQINAHATAGALVYAWAVDAVVYVRAILGGTAGNAIVMAYTDNDTNVGATKSATTLLGGVELEEGEDDFDDLRLEICNLVKDCCVAGVISQGTEIEAITLENGQSFDFKFGLPVKIPVLIRLTITQSENNLFVVGDPIDSKATLLANIAASYGLGKNFEPQRYFTVVNAPWASKVLLEWSSNGGGAWNSTIYDAAYNEIFTYADADVTIVED